VPLGAASRRAGSEGAPAVPSLGVAAVQGWTRSLRDVSRELGDPERIDMLRALEELVCAAAGAQVVVTAD
jgi:hypothetical protein